MKYAIVPKLKLLLTATSVLSLGLVSGGLVHPELASAATGACTAPATDYGTVSGLSVTTSGATTHIWSRIAIPDTTNNNFLLEVDNASGTALDCFTVTGAAGAVYTAAEATASTYFNNDSTNWVDTTLPATGTGSLPAGTYSLKLIGNAPNVLVDRVLLAQDASCTPTGTGDNCASPPDITPPAVNITSPATGASVASTTTVAVNATDDSGIVSKVELYIDGATTASQTDTSTPFSFTVTGLAIGSHSFVTKAYDPSNNVANSGTVTVSVADAVKPSVSITSPATGTPQSGTIAVVATATDNVGVSNVQFFTDSSTTPFSTVTTGSANSYSTSLATNGLANGSHTITAKATDAAGNTQTSTAVTITVTNTTGGTDTTAPTITITTPPASVILNTDLNNANFNSSSYAVNATAADASGIKQVVFKLDGTVVSTDTTAPYAYTLNLTTATCGAHTITATATDSSTNANTQVATAGFTATYSSDINNDCHATYLDLSGLASKYGQSGAGIGRADINLDGTVNYLDLSGLAAKYGKY